MEYIDKIVEYDKYCSKCEYEHLNGDGEPCNTCLTYPTNENSRKPIMFKEKKDNTYEVKRKQNKHKRNIKFVRKVNNQNGQ